MIICLLRPHFKEICGLTGNTTAALFHSGKTKWLNNTFIPFTMSSPVSLLLSSQISFKFFRDSSSFGIEPVQKRKRRVLRPFDGITQLRLLASKEKISCLGAKMLYREVMRENPYRFFRRLQMFLLLDACCITFAKTPRCYKYVPLLTAPMVVFQAVWRT